MRLVIACRPVPDAPTNPIESTPHSIGKAQSDAVDDRRAAVRPHDEQTFRSGRLFQRHFVVQRDIIAIEKHVTPLIKRVACNARRIAARHGNQHPAGFGQLLDRCGQAARPEFLIRRGALARQQGIDLGQRLNRRRFALRP